MIAKRSLRFFNTTGPCDPDRHYMLPPEDRLVGAQLHRYISDELYWVLHAPRQTGKTTFLQSWMREINSGSEAIACYVSVETCQGITDVNDSMPVICNVIKKYALDFGLPVPRTDDETPPSMLSNTLSNWANLVAPKPLIVLFDEVDVLQGETMISFLRQLRGGFASRGIGRFPVSIALVGMRDLKDYITASKDGVAPNPGSPFNIKADSAILSNFHKDDIAHLFALRTVENEQQITGEALDYVYEQTKGQPWIVNNLFMRATMRILDRDSTETVTLAHVEEAREQMVLARETHLDALAYRLEEPGVRSVIEPILTGEPDPNLTVSDAFRLCMDLGLVAIERGTPVIANPIYREVIARHLTSGQQMAIPEPEWKWEKKDGSLDMDRIMKEFQAFWKQHADLWEGVSKSGYTEAFPHLLLMAFLQRILNGGGTVDREYAAGRGRMDLHIKYNDFHYIIEIKLIHWYQTEEAVREKGLEQIRRYREKFDPDTPAYLVIFDRRNKEDRKPWNERISWEYDEDINVLGC
ncbi:MAG: PD-(D/E)XK nuclease domain-containing protein [Tannerella sp.]|jgi:hypothetical protein|nr:PD-(D/E)XK nuclease domain-containing protein [Tannerella sp.]